MARTPIIPRQPDNAVTAQTKLDLSPDPTIKGKDGAVRWYRDVMGLNNVGAGLVNKATNDKSLPSYEISQCRLVQHTRSLQLHPEACAVAHEPPTAKNQIDKVCNQNGRY